MAHFVDGEENIYRFDIEEKYTGSVIIYADSFEEALDFLTKQYEIHDDETQSFFNLRHCSTNFLDEDGNEYFY